MKLKYKDVSSDIEKILQLDSSDQKFCQENLRQLLIMSQDPKSKDFAIAHKIELIKSGQSVSSELDAAALVGEKDQSKAGGRGGF